MKDKMELYIEREAEKIRKEIEINNLSNIIMTPEQSERIWKNICNVIKKVYSDEFPY